MKLPNLHWPGWPRARETTATGVCVGESRLCVAVAGGSSRAARVLDAFEFPVGRGGTLEALEALAGDARLAGAIALGFDPRRELDDALVLGPEECSLSVAEILATRLPFEGGLVGAMRPVEIDGAREGTCVLVSALPSPCAAAAQSFAGRNEHRVLLLPVARALLQAAARKTRTPRRWTSAIRVLPAHKRGIAILSSGPHALAWRLFPWSPTDPVGSIATAARMLTSHAREELGIDAIDGMLVHGAAGEQSLAEKCGQKLGIAAEIGAPFAVDEAAIALALAEAALSHAACDMDLFEEPCAIAPRGKKRVDRRRVALLGAAAVVAGVCLCAIPRFASSPDESQPSAPAANGASRSAAARVGRRAPSDPERGATAISRTDAADAGAKSRVGAPVRELALDSTLITSDGAQALISGRTVSVGAAIEGVDAESPPVLAWVDGVRACVRYRNRDYVLDLDRARHVALDASGGERATDHPFEVSR